MNNQLLLAKQDLESYPSSDLDLLYSYYNIPIVDKIDRLWLLTLKLHTQRATMPGLKLHDAVLKGNCELVKELLKSGEDPNVGFYYNTSPLLSAAQKGDFECIKLLLDYGADPYAVTPDGGNVLYKAAGSGCAECLQLLLTYNNDINHQTELGYAPLHAAAEKGYSKNVELLLAAGADPHIKNRYDADALVSATAGYYGHSPKGREETIKLLLMFGATIPDHYSPNSKARKILEELGGPEGASEKYKEWLSKRPGRKTKAARMPSCNDPFEAIKNKDCECLQKLLEDGLDPNTVNENGNSLLYQNSVHGTAECAQLLLAAGADPNIQNQHEKTPLHSATWRWEIKITETLLQYGANPNAVDSKGMTPLHSMLEEPWHPCNSKIIEILLKAGANPQLRDSRGKTLLDYASSDNSNRKTSCIIALLVGGAIEGVSPEDYPNTRSFREVLTELGGPKVVHEKYMEWLSTLPGHRTKAIRK